MHLCLRSPCCQPMVGKPTCCKDSRGNPTFVDVWGDVLMAATLCFDTWRHRHNDIQRAIVTRALEARVEVEAKVFKLFRDIIPAAVFLPGGGLETVRQRQACIPDLQLGILVPLAPRQANYIFAAADHLLPAGRRGPPLSLASPALPRAHLRGF